jgi:tripartite motif-containing protein 71
MQPRELNRRDFFRYAGVAVGLSISTALGKDVPDALFKFVREFGKQGHGPGEFDSPVGLAIDARDRLYVSDFLNKRVQTFEPDGTFLTSFPVAPYPGGIAVDVEGLVYIAHWNDSKVAVYSPKGELVRGWGSKGKADGEFQLAGGLAVSKDGEVYVADQGNSRIQVFTREGKFLRKWGSLGGGPGQFGVGKHAGSRFAGPQFVALDTEGNVYATDAMSGRVQKFSREGELVSAFGSNSSEPGGFGGRKNPPVEGPIALCVDRAGRIWVGASNHRVQLFSPEGKYLYGIGGEGHGPGEFDTPHGMVVDSKGFLFVVDTMNGRIQKFEVS